MTELGHGISETLLSIDRWVVSLKPRDHNPSIPKKPEPRGGELSLEKCGASLPPIGSISPTLCTSLTGPVNSVAQHCVHRTILHTDPIQ